MSPRVPNLGVGAGLRAPHYEAILSQAPDFGFFEAISENYLHGPGRPSAYLDRVAERYPIVLHGVSLSIGGPNEPDRDYLRALKELARRVRAPWVSDHLCWSSAGGRQLHDLLPLPYTEEALERVTRRARQVQDYLELPFALENVSSYLRFRSNAMEEWEFLGRAAEGADIGLLLDVNNIFVSSRNHGFSPKSYLDSVPGERVFQYHLAGHTDRGRYLLDTHRGPMQEEVLTLHQEVLHRFGTRSTLVEWDDRIPPLEGLVAEVERVRTLEATLRLSGACARGDSQ